MHLLVSIIICTQDRAQSLDETLQSLGGIRVPTGYSVELLVADNASQDETKSTVERCRLQNGIQVRYLYEPRRGKSKAQNLALRNATGEILLFTDDDVRFPEDWLEGMCDPILQREADAVQGGIRWAAHLFQQCGASEFLYSVITSTGHKSEEEMRTSMIGANMAMSRRVYEALGEFDEALGPGALGFGEETLYGWRLLEAGYRKVNRLGLEIEHHFDASRLDRSRILLIAARHGASEGYLDYHWQHLEERWLGVRIAFMAAKDLVRTALTPRAWPRSGVVTPWKFSYRATLARLAYLRAAAGSERLYEKRGARKTHAVSSDSITASEPGKSFAAAGRRAS